MTKDNLVDLLRVAAAVRAGVTYGGVITNELQLWGFEVNGRVAIKKEESPHQQLEPLKGDW
jgi:hypothetical protein